MKVAFHVDQLFFTAPGGIGTYIRHLIPALTALEPTVDVHPFHLRFEGERPEPWLREYPTTELPRSIRTTYPRWNLSARPPLSDELAAMDVLHAPLPAAIPPAGSDQRLVVTVHDLAFERFPELFPRRWRWLFASGLRAAIRRADAIIVPSTSTADDLAEHGNLDSARVHVIPEATALPRSKASPDEVLARLGLPTPYLLSVGTLEPRKNLVSLVRAYRDAADAGLEHALVLAGPTGWHAQPLMDEIAEPGPGRIVLTGRLTDDDLDIVYRSAAAVAYVSLYEGFGLPVLEAMERGIPVLASDVSSIPEVAGDGAFLIDPTSREDIRDGIERVLTDRVLAQELSVAAVERSRRFSWDTAAAATRAVYEQG